MAQDTHAEGQFLQGDTQRWTACVCRCPFHFKESVTCSLGLHKSRPTRWGSVTTFSGPLTHSSARPDKREEDTGGEDQKKKREQHRSSWLVVESLAFFRAVASSQAHIIQSNLPGVTTPFFTFEDDLGREHTHWSGLFCPSQCLLI